MHAPDCETVLLEGHTNNTRKNDKRPDREKFNADLDPIETNIKLFYPFRSLVDAIENFAILAEYYAVKEPRDSLVWIALITRLTVFRHVPDKIRETIEKAVELQKLLSVEIKTPTVEKLKKFSDTIAHCGVSVTDDTPK